MVRLFKKEFKLTSLKLRPPGLTDLLTRRALTVHPVDFIFNISMLGGIITAITLELMYQAQIYSVLSIEWSVWLLAYQIHGVFGTLFIIGGLGYVVRYGKDKYFRLAYGKMFFVDAGFMILLALLGMGLVPIVMSITPTIPFMATLYSLFETLYQYHRYLTLPWIILSLVGNGAVRHAFATIVWRVNNALGRKPSVSLNLSACAKCGRCLKACTIFGSLEKKVKDTPALKMRIGRFTSKYLGLLKTLSESEAKKMVEENLVCTLCGLCVSVCPYSFDNVVIMRNLAAKRGYFPEALKEGATQIIETGLLAPVTAFIMRKRKQLGLPELPPVAVEEIREIIKATRFDSLISKVEGVEGQNEVMGS